MKASRPCWRPLGVAHLILPCKWHERARANRISGTTMACRPASRPNGTRRQNKGEDVLQQPPGGGAWQAPARPARWRVESRQQRRLGRRWRVVRCMLHRRQQRHRRICGPVGVLAGARVPRAGGGGGCAVDQVQDLATSQCGLSQGRPSSDPAMCVRRLAISREFEFSTPSERCARRWASAGVRIYFGVLGATRGCSS